MWTRRLLAVAFVTFLLTPGLGLAEDKPKGDEPKKPSSIFDFGVEPLAPGDSNPQPKAKADDVGKPQTPKADSPKVEAPKADSPRAETPKVEDGKSDKTEAIAKKPKDVSAQIDLEMLRACHVSPDGVITVDKDITFGLKGTQGKDFVITGELYPTQKPVLYNTGGIIFHFRQLSGTKRYELSIGGMRVKRVLLEGEVVKKFASPMKFKGIAREQWHPFRIEVSGEAITVRFDDQEGIARGPLEKGGQNHIILGPGAKLKNLKVEIKGAAKG